MSFDTILGLVLLFFAYRVVRAIMKSVNAASTNTRREPTQATSPETPKPVYRSPRDMTARPAARGSGSVPRAVLRMKSTMLRPASQAPRSQSGSPFIIDRPRRFPLLGILAVAAIIVLISSCYAWLTEPPQRPAPGRNAERALHLHAVTNAIGPVISPVG